MNRRRADPGASRAVLVGVTRYGDPEFPSIPAAFNSLDGFHRVLVDPELCGWPHDRVTVMSNPSSERDIAVQLHRIAAEAQGTLLFYYVGHGALTASGDLCLTTTSTSRELPEVTGVPWAVVSRAMGASPARVRIAILDCCFAGKAIQTLAGDTETVLSDLAGIEGVYTLTATTANRTAHVPARKHQAVTCTSFTGELLALLATGIPGGGEKLTLGEIYPALAARLAARGLPRPQQRGTDTAFRYAFTKNLALLAHRTGHEAPRSPPPSPRDEWQEIRRSAAPLDARVHFWWSVAAAVALTSLGGAIDPTFSDEGYTPDSLPEQLVSAALYVVLSLGSLLWWRKRVTPLRLGGGQHSARAHRWPRRIEWSAAPGLSYATLALELSKPFTVTTFGGRLSVVPRGQPDATHVHWELRDAADMTLLQAKNQFPTFASRISLRRRVFPPRTTQRVLLNVWLTRPPPVYHVPAPPVVVDITWRRPGVFGPPSRYLRFLLSLWRAARPRHTAS